MTTHTKSEAMRDHFKSDRHLNKECKCWGSKHTDESRAKISAARLGWEYSQETRDKISKTLKGRNHSIERRQNISNAQLGKKRGPHSELHRQALSAAQKIAQRKHADLDLPECKCIAHSASSRTTRGFTQPELALHALLDKAGVHYIVRKKVGRKEIDAYAPDYKIAFEAYGTYYHYMKPGAIEKDAERTRYLEARDEVDKVIVFWDDELLEGRA